ncbi:MAG TPA: acyl-CoA dehydrogenase family protein [Candidatus Limnocylindrales bacterium]|nr:acyl-CoA dehydrogenase family protein [Candidatus Limnocylindrales bacterium]
MADTAKNIGSEEESRRVAEESREQEWAGRAFIRELYLGQLPLDIVHPFPIDANKNPEFVQWLDRLEAFLRDAVDSAEIDRTGEYPDHVVDGLRKLGAFGIKIPKKYGGLGFSVTEYCQAMELIGSYDGNLVALLSAHQSIGVPQPLKDFGTEEQKQKFLTRCAKGAISAFALTEPNVGSDPSSLSTTCEQEGDFWVLNGEKLWCTNGTLAELFVVMARNPKTKKISAFVVDADTPGVKVEHRSRFMGLRALANGVISFTDVRVPKENLIGAEGQGLKIALMTLNTGRLSLPAACVGSAKRCLEVVKGWSAARAQWGVPIWKHEAISNKIASIAAVTFAMDSIAKITANMAQRGGYDIRLEAAAAKEWNSVQGWKMIDETLQIRGGRGYENETSLRERGETGIPIERMMRDSRINLIFEGSSEVMHLFMAREAVDKHLQVAGAMIDPKSTAAMKMSAMPSIMAFYAGWYPPLWLKGLATPFQYGEWGELAGHIRFVDRGARKLARSSFHAMALYQAKMERKQAFLFRTVDIVMELFAMSVVCSRARQMKETGDPNAAEAMRLADLFCALSRRKVQASFRALWRNDDAASGAVTANVMKGNYDWLAKDGVVDMQLPADAYEPKMFALRNRDAA